MHLRQRNKFLQIVLLLVVIVIATIWLRNVYRDFYRKAYPVHYSEHVLEYSQHNNLPPSLVYAVIRAESGFNPNAQSSVEARGLMQITKNTFEWAQFREREVRELEFDDLFNSETNIQYGTAILRLLLEEFDTVPNALCAYHAGWGNATKWLENPQITPDGINIEHIPFGDTSYYVKRVQETREMYQRLYGLD